MGCRHLVLALAAAAVLVPFPIEAQQQPIFGCRHAISCRPSPTGASALNDSGASGLLLGSSIRWGPGFHFGLVTPILKLPAPETSDAIDIHAFRLRNVTLLPPPEATPTPTPPNPRGSTTDPRGH